MIRIDYRKKNKYKCRNYIYTVNDFYREYKHEVGKKYGKDRVFSKKIFVSVIKMYFRLLVKKIVIERRPFRLPKRLGYIGVTKLIAKNTKKNSTTLKHVDMTGKNADKKLYFMTQHYKKGSTYFAWKWWKTNNRSIVKYINYYGFKPEYKYAKRVLSDHIYECSKDPYMPDYDVVDFQVKRPNNALKLPLPP